MAYECWRESERFVYDSHRSDMRKFFSVLVNIEEHRVYVTYADERFFRELRELLEKKWPRRIRRNKPDLCSSAGAPTLPADGIRDVLPRRAPSRFATLLL
jgi:hypothetical protein